MIEKIISDKDGERYIGPCNHCGNVTSQRILFQYEGSEIAQMGDGKTQAFDVYYSLTKCEVCDDVLLYGRPEYDDETYFGYVLYPEQKSLSDAVPLEIRKVYSEAKAISKIAPNAFAVQIRRALEFLCTEKKVKGKDLNEQIGSMAEMGMIPPVLATMTNGIRHFGNIGAHASDVEVTKGDVVLIDDFFKAIVEYVYVAPGKIDALQKRLESMK